jgi:hypothetical protein
MSFCTPSDFDLLPYAIPNLSLVVNSFQRYVNEREAEALKKLLGVQLYKAFIAGLEALPDDWSATVNYTVGMQVTYGLDIFEALTDNLNTIPEVGAAWSLIEEGNKWLKLEKGFEFSYYGVTYQWLGMVDMLKPYIFSYWTRDTFDNNSGIGVVQGKAENAEVIEPKTRIVRSYNEYAHRARTLAAYIESVNVGQPPLYENWQYHDPCSMNTFGL